MNNQERIRVEGRKPTKVASFTMILYSSEKQYSRYKAIFPLNLLSQKCCEVYVISYGSDPAIRLDYKI